jgi:putative hydroxymethylpyrimidine transport system substrate-binding protein
MTRRRITVIARVGVVALVLAALALAVAACGERKEPTGTPPQQKLSLMLDFFPNADHAGIYAAKASGDFSRAGLDVDIQTPSDPSAPLKLLAAGRVDLAVSYEPELLLARDQGLKLVAVGAIVQKPLTSIISIGKHAITNPAQLKGKTVGTAGIPYQSAYLHQILTHAAVNPSTVKEVNVGFNLVPAMKTGKVDATLGAFWNYEGVQLRLQRQRPKIIHMEGVGVPTYQELIVVARQQDLAHGGERVRRFMRALGQGYAAVRRNPQAGIKPLLAANPDLDPKLQLASVQATLPVFFPVGGKPFGWMAPGEWARYGDWMFQNKLLKNAPNAARALTDEFLPGQGLTDTGAAG